MYLELVLPEERQTDEQVIDAYYDHVEAKERNYYRESSFDEPEELQADFGRDFAQETLEEEDEIFIYEYLHSDIFNDTNLDLSMFPSYNTGYKDVIIYKEDINKLILELERIKGEMEQNNSKNWELTFESQSIALCEFALKHGYGVGLSH